MEKLPTHSKQKDDFPNEKWVDLDYGEGSYSISTYGRVYSNARTCKDRWGNEKPIGDHFMKIIKEYSGNTVNLSFEGVKKKFYLPTLICQAFLRNKKEGECVMHISKNVWDDRIENLQIVSNSESKKRDFTHGKHDGKKLSKSGTLGLKNKYSKYDFGDKRKCTKCKLIKNHDDFTDCNEHKRYKCNHCLYIEDIERGGRKSSIIENGIHGKSKLSVNEVLEIRSIYDQKWASNKDLMEAYNLSASTIHNIVNRKTHKHI